MPPCQGTPQPPPDAEPASAENRRRLVTLLWEHLRAKESPLWRRPHFSDRVAFPVQLVHDALGRPHLLLGEHRGPAISFSKAGEEVWAALCGDGSDIGIDVAGSAEFQEGYPVHRVFHEQELHQALELAGGDLAKAAALLWSIKEAVAKALGCAFHLVRPAGNPCLSIGSRGWRACLLRAFIGESSGALSHGRPPTHHGTFAAPGGDVALHRRLASAAYRDDGKS